MPELPRADDEFAGYLLRAVIARGGMSVVYEAEHPRLGNGIALKVLAPELAADEVFRTRFLTDSRIAASMNHPHIIPIYDVGSGDGMLYIAMRRVSGNNLRQMIARRGPLPPQTVVSLLSQAARALDAAHRTGLVHRDVKPENLLIETDHDADDEHVYLADFGISRLGMERNGLTSTGQFLGTVNYVAPEQLSEPSVYGSADQYSLGCVLYECVTGRVPFDKDVDAAAIRAGVHKQETRPAPPRTDLPPAVDEMFARVLAERPGDRYNTCREFIEAAGVALGDAAIAPWPSGRSRLLPARPAVDDQPEVAPEVADHQPEPASAACQPTAAPVSSQPSAVGYQPAPVTAGYQPAPTLADYVAGSAPHSYPPEAAPGSGGHRPQAEPGPAADKRDPDREEADVDDRGARSGRRWGDWLVIAAVLLLVCAGGGAYAVLSSRPKAGGSPAAKASKSMTALRPRASTLTRVLTAADGSKLAMGMLPPSSCRQRGPATVVCTAPWPAITRAAFTVYPTRAALFSAYEAKVRSLHSGRYRQNVKDCGLTAPSPYSEIAWNHQEQHSRAYTVGQMRAGRVPVETAMGRLACMMTASHSEDIVWTTDYGKMLGVAIGRGSHTGVWLWWVAVHHNIVFPGTPMDMGRKGAPLMSGAPLPTSSASSSSSMSKPARRPGRRRNAGRLTRVSWGTPRRHGSFLLS